MARFKYTGLASEINGKPVPEDRMVELTQEQADALVAHGSHTFEGVGLEESDKPTPQEVNAAFDPKTGEADLSKAGDAKKK